MSLDRRRELVDPTHPALSVVRQCELMSISRSGFYYQPVGETPANLALMRVIDEQFLETPWYGTRQNAVLSTSSKSVILLTWLRRLLLRKYAIDAGPANAEPSCNIGRPEPPRRKGQRGRPPLKGRRLPTLRAVLASRKTVWTTVVVSQWYNAQQRK